MAVRIESELRLPDDEAFVVNPVIVVEVLSPSRQRIDVITKFGR